MPQWVRTGIGLILNLLLKCDEIPMMELSKREINVLICGAAFILLFLVSEFVVFPFFDKRDNLERILAEKQIALEEMLLEQGRYQSLSNRFDTKKEALINREKQFSLFPFLDSQAEKSGVKENVAYMKPFTKLIENSAYKVASVKIKLSAVYLKELIDFVYLIETSRNAVTITSLSLSKTGKEKIKLDAVIEAETLMLMNGA